MNFFTTKPEGEPTPLEARLMENILDLLFNEWAVGLGVPLLIGIAFALLADEFKQFTAARVLFILAAASGYGKDAKESTPFNVANKALHDMKQPAEFFTVLNMTFLLQFQQIPSMSGLAFLSGIKRCK